jgi:tetratricopeptide (TPR) repeat protein
MHFGPPRCSFAIALLAMFLACWSGVPLLAQESTGAADFDATSRSATAAREAGHADEAIQEYQRALNMRPQWEEGWWYLGTLLYDQDKYSQAIPAFAKLVELMPNAGPAWDFLGLCEFETKDYANSLQHLEKGLSFGDADDPETALVSNYHLSLLLIRKGEFDRAAALLTSSFGRKELSPQIKSALALAMLRVPLLPSEIDPSRDALIRSAGEVASAIAQNDSARALASFPSLLHDYPDVPYLHFAYGKTLTSAGRDEEALKQQKEETVISKASVLPWIEISQIELRLQHPQEALLAARQAVQREADSSASHRVLAHILEALGKKEEAAGEITLAEKLEPEKTHPEQRLAQLYSNHVDQRSEANPNAATRKAEGSDSSSFEELSRRAATAQAAGDTEQAISNYQQALQLRPDWDEGRWNLATLLYFVRQYPEAIPELKKSVVRRPNFGPAWALLGLCEFEIKDYENALVHLQRGEQLGFGGNPEAEGQMRYHVALLQNRKGEFDSAMETLLPGTHSSALARETQIALGLAMLHMPVLPDQLEPSKISLVESAGEIAALLQNSKYDQAFPKIEALLAKYPAAPFLHYAYGTALAALSEFDKAETQFREESKISPASELPYVRLASLSLKQHHPDEALLSAQQAVKLAPNSAEAHYVLGRTYLELSNSERALSDLERARELDPGSPEIHFSLARAYAKAKLPDKAEQERATFVRLNALMEQRRRYSNDQSYSGAQNEAGLGPGHSDTQ